MVALDSTSIRTGAVSRLTGKTQAGSRVWDSRTRDFQRDELPALSVFSQTARLHPASKGYPIFEREERLTIEGHTTVPKSAQPADPDADLASRLDTLEAEILATLYADPSWVSSFESFSAATVTKGQNRLTDFLSGIVQVQMSAEYTERFDPTPTDDFDVVRAKSDIPGGESVDHDAEFNP